jgi:tetratricopeptide (TPR) repeat protein
MIRKLFRRVRTAACVSVRTAARVSVLAALAGVLCAALPLAAQEEAAAFGKATEAYRGGRYREAADLYESIVKNGWESATLYYNLGNAHYKLGEIPAAILNYERALRLSPGDDDIEHNLAMAELKTVDRIDPLPRLFFVAWWSGFLALASPGGWGAAAIVCLWIAAASGVGVLAAGSVAGAGIPDTLRGVGRMIAIVSLAAAVVAFAAGHFRNEEIYGSTRGVIFSQSVTAKSAPDEQSTDIFVIHEGLRVEILDAVGGWMNIRLADGKTGWMKEDHLLVI